MVPTVPIETGPVNNPITSPCRLLLVEPSRPLSKVLALALRRHGHCVEVVGYPLAVPYLLRMRRHVDAVVLDPGDYRAWRLIVALRTIPALRTVPFILVTGRPLNFESLLQIVDGVAERRLTAAP